MNSNEVTTVETLAKKLKVPLDTFNFNTHISVLSNVHFEWPHITILSTDSKVRTTRKAKLRSFHLNGKI